MPILNFFFFFIKFNKNKLLNYKNVYFNLIIEFFLLHQWLLSFPFIIVFSNIIS